MTEINQPKREEWRDESDNHNIYDEVGQKGYDEEGNYDKTLEMSQINRKESDMAKAIREQHEDFTTLYDERIRIDEDLHGYLEKDVKEFIKRLKEEFSTQDEADIIDKLAGDKLR